MINNDRMNALYFTEFGSSSVLQYGVLPLPVIGENEVLVEMRAIGLNFADIYRRKGDYHIEKSAHYILGYEGAGVVVAVGDKVSAWRINDRVGFADCPFANAEYVAVPQDKLIKLPDTLSFTLASSILLQGLTADFLINDCAEVNANETVFVHGISGGVGQLLLQMLVRKQVNVVGLTSSDEKRAIALKMGAREVWLRRAGWKTAILSAGLNIRTVFDGIGSTLLDSLDIVEHRGRVIFFGMAGGETPRVDPIKLLNQSKSIVTGDLWDFLTDQAARVHRSQRLFSFFTGEDAIKITEPTLFALSDGKAAHDLLESGHSIGKIILVP